MTRIPRDATIAAAVAVMVLANLPGAGVGELIRRLGLGQSWDLFAPAPIAARIELEADVTYADGTTRSWRPPALDPLLQEAGYRWQHWSRALTHDDRSDLWEPAARWIARLHTDGDQRPVRVTLRRRFAELPAPGERDRRLRWTEFDFFTLDLHGTRRG